MFDNKRIIKDELEKVEKKIKQNNLGTHLTKRLDRENKNVKPTIDKHASVIGVDFAHKNLAHTTQKDNFNFIKHKNCTHHFFARPFFKNASQRKAVEAAPRQQMLK